MILLLIVIIVFTGLSFSRILSVKANYAAPINLFTWLNRHELGSGKLEHWPVNGDVNICLGKEWYRFPSNFFLPGERYKLHFIKSGFKGLLPKPFPHPSNPNITSTSSTENKFNDQNKHEPDRFIPDTQCHYIIEQEFEGQEELSYYNNVNYLRIRRHAFLESRDSHPVYRAFHVPFVSHRYTRYNNFYIFKNVALIFEQNNGTTMMKHVNAPYTFDDGEGFLISWKDFQNPA